MTRLLASLPATSFSSLQATEERREINYSETAERYAPLDQLYLFVNREVVLNDLFS